MGVFQNVVFFIPTGMNRSVEHNGSNYIAFRQEQAIKRDTEFPQ
jgi:hypothetical protein